MQLWLFGAGLKRADPALVSLFAAIGQARQ